MSSREGIEQPKGLHKGFLHAPDEFCAEADVRRLPLEGFESSGEHVQDIGVRLVAWVCHRGSELQQGLGCVSVHGEPRERRAAFVTVSVEPMASALDSSRHRVSDL
jgi:hypothetical protein